MLLAWGSNAHGECCSGDNSENAEPRPRCVNGVLRRSLGQAPSVASVASGKAYTLLLMDSGDVYGCGRGKEGQLGFELSANCIGTRQPVLISALRPWRISHVSCGYNHSTAVSRCGQAFEWGLLLTEAANDVKDTLASRVGGLGRDFTEDLSEREQRIVAESWSKYMMNSQSDNSVEGEDAIALFQSQSSQRSPVRAPRRCTGLDDVNVRMICCGYAHSAALVEDGVIMAHGYNEKGQLGNGVRLPSQHFVRVDTSSYGDGCRAATLSCGLNHNAAILESGGQVLTWGMGTFGQLGLGHLFKESCKPLEVALSLEQLVVGVACGDNHTAVLLKGGNVYAFGHRDALGGKSHEKRMPERVQGLRPGGVQSIFAGGNGSFAVVKDDDVNSPEVLHAWGYNQRFQLGRYTGELQVIVPGPTALPRLPGMSLKCLDAGMYHCLAVVGAPTVPILPPHVGDRCFGSASMCTMLDGEVEFDTSLKVSGGESLGAHHCVLTARCPRLAAQLQTMDVNGDSTAPCRWELDLSKHCGPTVRALLEYIYCDYCRAAPDVAASLKPLADEFSLPRLAAGVAAATQTESLGSGVVWVRTAAGNWVQMAADAAPREVIESTYTQDLSRLIQTEDSEAADCVDFVKLNVKQDGSTHSRSVRAARPFLLTSDFFRALLDGGFAEAQGLRTGSGQTDVSADNVDAFVLCLQMLATGEAGPLMPSISDEIFAVMVEAHRLGFSGAFSAAEQALGKLVRQGDVETEALEAIAGVAHLDEFERLANEAARSCKDRKSP